MAPHAVASTLLTIFLSKSQAKHPLRPDIKWFVLIAAVSFGSHFVMDGIPHYDYSLYDPRFSLIYKIGLDLFFTLLTFVFVFWVQVKSTFYKNLRYLRLLFLVMWGIPFAWLPDILMFVLRPRQDNMSVYLVDLHDSFHSKTSLDAWIGIFVYLLICIISSLIARRQVRLIEERVRIDEKTQQIEEEFADYFGPEQY